MLSTPSDTGVVSPHGALVNAFMATARLYPLHPAIVHNGLPVTYAELAALARGLAQRLGARPGVVAVMATRSPHTVAALLGVWAAGGVYCPIDPAFPVERQRAMLAAAGCRMVLSARHLEPTMVGDSSRAEELAYCLFTSGSTGEPKAVLTPSHAIETAIRSISDLFGLTVSDRVLQFASLNWDTCFEEILPVITTGASLIIHDEAHTGSFPRLLRMLNSEQVSVLNLPTAFWHELVHYLTDEGASLPNRLRLVIIGGEAANPARLADWYRLDTRYIRLLNTYGCTETTLITHAIELDGPVERVPIGRPLPHVVERLGEDGELLIGGPALATGYRGLPEATKAKFINLPAGRFFRTGDRVSRLPDGSLVHDGRLDNEIKIRGIRVDPAEVEAQIARHPAVGAVAVVGIRVADHTALAAFVVPGPQADGATLAADIHDFLRSRVPAHLMPSRISIVSELAYTASGKVDRRRIKESFL